MKIFIPLAVTLIPPVVYDVEMCRFYKSSVTRNLRPRKLFPEREIKACFILFISHQPPLET